jgi:hypothetical protein
LEAGSSVAVPRRDDFCLMDNVEFKARSLWRANYMMKKIF